MKTTQVLFIVINYFNEKEVIEFSNHLANQKFNNYELLIVNNGSKNHNLLFEAKRNSEKIKLIQPNKNLGYLQGANFALTSWLDDNPNLPEFVILCNTDIAFEDNNFFNDLFTTTGEIIGPSIFSSRSKNYQNPYYQNRISVKKLNFLSLIYSFYPFYILYQTIAIIKAFIKQSNSEEQQNQQQVYAVHGSFMIFRNNYFINGGNFNYGSFLYGEELFIAETALQNNLQVIYNPLLKIIHHEHSTTGTYKKPAHIKFMKQSIDWNRNTYFIK